MTIDQLRPGRRADGAGIPRPLVFWIGVALTSVGVLLHLPAYYQMRDMGYRMAGMKTPASMTVGMAMLFVGVVVTGAGLLQRTPPPDAAASAARYEVRPGVSESLSKAQKRLVAVLSLALLVDVMKPATLAFILPGLRQEYHMSVAGSSSLPVTALTGTVVGSLIWGYLGDRIGRRATVLLSSVMFISSTVCSMMPTFTGNLVMCFWMGAAAGGLLPVVYAMMAESVPARQRGFIMVLQAGLATSFAYFATAGLAAWLIPHFGWRVMWFTHFPIALAIVLLHRWVPESPRFLVRYGQIGAARSVAEKYGMELVAVPYGRRETAEPARVSGRGALSALFGRGGVGRTLVVGLYALSWGCVNWGFMTYVPTVLKNSKSFHSSGSTLIVYSSALAVPGTALVAFCYAKWSSRKAMALFGGLTAGSLLAMTATGLGGGKLLTIGLLMLLITGSSGVVAMLAPYTAEVYPTEVRGAGSGFAAACSKAGGMFGPPALAVIVDAFPGVRVISLVTAVPMTLATVAIALKGRETSGRDLEEFDAAAPGHSLAVPAAEAA